MKIILYRFALVCLFACFPACSSNRGDPLASQDSGTGDFGGQLTEGKGGPNQAVTDQYKWMVSQDLIPLVYHAYEQGLSALSTLPDNGGAKSARVSGYYFGYALVTLDSSVTNNAGIAVKSNFTITFYNFSDSSTTFVGGKVSCQAEVTLQNGVWQPHTLILGDGMLFAGDFGGSIVFDTLQVPCNSQGQPFSVFATMEMMNLRGAAGSLTFTSGGNTIRFNPYYRKNNPFGGWFEPPPPF